MTILFPRLGSPQLEPYEAPFGRMMLAFARATAAVIELVIQVQGKGEAEVVRFVTTAGTKDLPKKLRRLFKNKLDKEQDAKLRQVADEYKRWVKPISPRTVRRQLNIIQRVFQAAIEYRDGFSSLPNHFLGIRVQGSTGGRRERSSEGNELERILKACEKCRITNNYYVTLAIHLGIDTGMRRQEIFNLVWADIDDNNRRIKIRKSKTDKATGKTDGAMIVLPAKANMLLVALVMALIADADHALYVAQREEEGQPKVSDSNI